ncbi:cardiolipin synthase [Methanogenium organophilum]|uniref:Cardiolipin synthase n=1 Tax=Methanogenium organophilum TaxID=2199 RepID=A0A9X9S848_METOG|nr:cardiolipin synthase [Methanogenium organophilum]WAI02510.1 cardiolipin synthase [Methanogenium organophilum]
MVILLSGIDIVGYSLLGILLVANFSIAITVVFVERKKPSTALLWVAVLFFLPIFGFLLYLVFGQNIYKERIFRLKEEDDHIAKTLIASQEERLSRIHVPFEDKAGDYLNMVTMLLRNDGAVLSNDNTMEVYTNGYAKFEALMEAIAGAEDFIHLEYYIIRNDTLSRQITSALVAKAREGVTVRVLGDAVGCHGLPRNFFSELMDAGGEVAFFFRSKYLHINMRVNYRNHRKIAIIDGKTGFIGGYNIGDEYLGKGPLGNWRDTHLKITGTAVHSLQVRFFMDWNHAAGADLGFDERYFPVMEEREGALVQIVASGPDSRGEAIKKGYLSLIHNARESVWIQTPYFIPDASIMDALTIAAESGVDVRIMVPCKPDHPFVYWAGFSYLWELMESGVRVYTYDDGFIHAKTVTVDGIAASVGSANWDIRSFSLNFEANAFLYRGGVPATLKQIFADDIASCTEVTPEMYGQRTHLMRFKESFSRLFSGIL